ncbi:neuromedin-K receptor-like [Stylophora pistillata]|uniref:neuromedin-K receptor-like n=1 Tax=Stylophora pistillata TaxID=50429 RepID=UPI000C0518F8|nr:neuromedin-K receptor-like [Stylophora pistillata]
MSRNYKIYEVKVFKEKECVSVSCQTDIDLKQLDDMIKVILNIITITVFVKQRQLRRRSTYLIIHLAMVDLLVGAVSGPMQIHLGMVWCYGELESYDVTYFRIRLAIAPFFSFASLVNLTFISLERTHATYRPFNHRFIRKWVYGLIIAFIYLSTICKGAIEGLTDWLFRYIWVFSSYFILLVVICVCYISIYIKVHCSHHPQHHGAAGLRERKLTRTLFFVTLASILSFLPVNIYSGISLDIVAVLKFPSHFQISITTLTLLLANSLVNPLIYVVRMPEFRAGI